MKTLKTSYMGIELDNPIIIGASDIVKDLDSLKKAEELGAGAIIYKSLFEEQIQLDARELDFYMLYGTERFAESLTYFPQPAEYHLAPEQYLAHVARAKAAVKIPIIASLNGISPGGWVQYARKMEDAGADALELNVYFIPTDPRLTSERVESVYLAVLAAVKACVSIPVAMKLSPYFSSTANFVTRLDQAGADALVLFNRFYQPDINLDDLEVQPNLVLSSPSENPLPMRWMAILHGKLRASLAAGTGIQTAEDVVKMIMAGADATMLCSCLLRNGIDHLATLHQGVSDIMQAKEYDSISQMKGVLSQRKCPEPAAFERANYMKTIGTFGPTMTLE